MNLKQIDDISKEVDKRLADFEKKINNKVQPLDKKLGEVEQETLWKIKDCENLLKTRVNTQFVMDAMKSAEDKIIREVYTIYITGVRQIYIDQMGQSNNEKFDLYNKMYAEISLKIKNLEQSTNEKVKANEASMDSMNRKYEIYLLMYVIQLVFQYSKENAFRNV